MSKRKRYGAEEIIAKLREAAVHLAQGQTVGQTARQLGISEQTYYRWRREYGGMRVDQAKRLKELERENSRLKGDFSPVTRRFFATGWRSWSGRRDSNPRPSAWEASAVGSQTADRRIGRAPREQTAVKLQGQHRLGGGG